MKKCDNPLCRAPIPSDPRKQNVFIFSMGGLGGEMESMPDPKDGGLMNKPASKHKMRLCNDCIDEINMESREKGLDSGEGRMEDMKFLQKILLYYDEHGGRKKYLKKVSRR